MAHHKFHEGKHFANMPSEPVFKEYSKEHEYMNVTPDDTETGINQQMGEDARVRNKITKPRKA